MQPYWDNGLKSAVGVAVGFLAGGLLVIVLLGRWPLLPLLLIPFLSVPVRAMMIRQRLKNYR